MTKSIVCKCPGCESRVVNYVRKGTKEWSSVKCYECGLRFKINIKDFYREDVK